MLIEQIKEGDINAFRQLVEKYKDVSLSLTCSILKNEVLAEDVLQEVFLKVYHNIKSFKAKSSFATWLYRIVVNSCYNELKRIKNHQNITEIDNNLYYDNIDLEHKKLNTKEQQNIINTALKKIKSDEALVLRLFYLCELKISEIEKITSYSKSKIKVDLHRGRQNLQSVLNKLLGTEIENLL